MKLVESTPTPKVRTPRKPAAKAAQPEAPARYVTIPNAAARIGLTEKAIRRKIEAGKWLEGREFRRAPDGGIFVDLHGFYAWVEGGAKPH